MQWIHRGKLPLTTTFCVVSKRASGLKVRLGEWDAKANIEPFKYVESVVSRIRINPFFNRVNLQNDIAVLTLDRPIDLAANPHINPVCAAQYQSNYAGQRYRRALCMAMTQGT